MKATESRQEGISNSEIEEMIQHSRIIIRPLTTDEPASKKCVFHLYTWFDRQSKLNNTKNPDGHFIAFGSYQDSDNYQIDEETVAP